MDYQNLNLLNPAIKNAIAAQYGEEELELKFGENLAQKQHTTGFTPSGGIQDLCRMQQIEFSLFVFELIASSPSTQMGFTGLVENAS